MKFTATVVQAILVSLAMALPSGNLIDHLSPCLTSTSVKQVVSDYTYLIGAYNDELADRILHPGFTDSSDSINVFIGKPLGSVTFPSKQDFMTAQAALQPIPLSVTSVEAYTCDTVVVKWAQTFGQSPQTVAGISVLNMKKGKDGWKFYRIITEFNSLIYLANMGGTYTLPGQ